MGRDVRPRITPRAVGIRVLDPHHLGHSTDFPMGSRDLYLNAGSSKAECGKTRCGSCAKAVTKVAHHTSVRLGQRLAK